MVNGLIRARRWDHGFLRFAILPVGYPDFVQVEYQIAGASMDSLLHAAYRFIQEDSRNLQTRFFLGSASCLSRF
jgi:hypothetical protein